MGTVWTNDLRKGRLERPAIFRVPALTATAIILSVVGRAAAYGQPVSPQPSASQQQEWERLFAASPQRELRQEWDRCVNNVAELIIAQGGTLDQVRRLAFGGCADEQSRLTGTMVREFGYERGNRAVQGVRDQRLRSFERRIAGRASPSQENGAVATTPEGWRIRRVAPQNCDAILLVPSIFGSTAAFMVKTPREDTLEFVELGSDARSRASSLRAGDTVTTAVIAIGRNTDVTLGRLSLKLDVVPEGYGFLQPMDARILRSLGGAVAVQFRVAIGNEGSRVHTYRVEGIVTARQALLQCAER
jgi:hypothetical protein